MKILSAFKCMFPAESLQKQSSQTIKGDHPKLDDSESVSKEEKTNMSKIGTSQWLVTLG